MRRRMDTVFDLAANVLCVGVPGAEPETSVLEDLADLRPGGLILFARNVGTPEKTRALVTALVDAIGGETRAYVGVDQEGGRVARLGRGFTDVPSMMAVAATGDVSLAERIGRVLAADVRRIGANVDFAPVLDLALAPDSDVIGARAFGDDPELVATFGASVMRGLLAGGVAATPKHFPGHGSTAADSHVGLPIVDAGIDVLRARDLVPFARAIAAGAPAIMTAHVVVPALDPDRPATLSPRILRGLLRDELGFAGCCFTDSIEMQAIARKYGVVRGAVLALCAGADAILVSHSLSTAREIRAAIAAAVDSGELPLERLEEAARRVHDLRVRFAHSPVDEPGDLDAPRGAARRSITVVRGDASLPRERPVSIVSFEGATIEGAVDVELSYPSLALALRERKYRAELLRVPLAPDRPMIDQLLTFLRAQGERSLVVLSRRAHREPAQRAAIDAILAAMPEAVLCSVREPFDVACFPQATSVVCTYGDRGVSIDALADVLAGREHAAGRLPVTVAL
jgi:beta-N-acetylhexosaminidase